MSYYIIISKGEKEEIVKLSRTDPEGVKLELAQAIEQHGKFNIRLLKEVPFLAKVEVTEVRD